MPLGYLTEPYIILINHTVFKPPQGFLHIGAMKWATLLIFLFSDWMMVNMLSLYTLNKLFYELDII